MLQLTFVIILLPLIGFGLQIVLGRYMGDPAAGAVATGFVGASFLVESFVTVVVGGANVLLGTAPAGILLAMVRTGLNGWGGQIIGQIGMLLAVIVVIRILPEGLSGWFGRRTR